MADNLQQKTVRALAWSFLEAAAQRGVQFAVGVVLARLLFPEQFGLIGMLAIFMAVAQAFLDSGFGAALIQKAKITQTDICSIFYFNIAVGLAAAGLLCVIAPWVAAFYHQPILTPLTRALSLTIVINSFGLIQDTILIKDINFKTYTKVSVIAGVSSGVIGIGLAASGFGVWSLAIQQISSAFFRTVFLWLYNPWRPTLVFSFTALREMFGFGSRLLVSGLLNQFFENIYLLVIGKLFSASDLGFFTRAKTLNDLPTLTLSGMVARVTFPVFSAIQDDRARLKRGLKKALSMLVMLNFPMMVGLSVIAHPLVILLLTEKWTPCVPYLQLLCAVGLLFPLHMMNLNVLQALGRSDLFLRLEIIKKILIVVNIGITWRWGISAMIAGIVVNSVISFFLNSYYNGSLIHYGPGEQLRDLFPYLAASFLMGSTVYAVGLLHFPRYWSQLLAQIAAGMIAYGCLCRVFRLKAFMDAWEAMWSRMQPARAGTTR